MLAKYYSADDMPSENEMRDDLQKLVQAYIDYIENKTSNAVLFDGDNQQSLILKPNKVWVIAIGENSEYFDEFYKINKIAIGWDDIGDLRQYSTKKAIQHALDLQRNSSSDINLNVLWNFQNEIEIGDLILVRKGLKTIIAAGLVTGDYEHDNERSYFKNVRNVKWLKTGEWNPFFKGAHKKQFAIQTLNEVTPNTAKRRWRHEAILINLFQKMGLTITFDNLNLMAVEDSYEAYTIDDALEGLFLERESFENILKTWKSKKNIILQGSPGVGKRLLPNV